MAKYLPTVDLWKHEETVRTGSLKLQCGQWVTCGEGVKSRFVSTNGKSILVAHGGSTKEVCSRFFVSVAAMKQARERRANYGY